MFQNYSTAQIALSLVMLVLFFVQVFFFVKWVMSLWSDETCATWSVFGYLTIINYVQSFLYILWRKLETKPRQIQQQVYAAKTIPMGSKIIPAAKVVAAAAPKH